MWSDHWVTIVEFAAGVCEGGEGEGTSCGGNDASSDAWDRRGWEEEALRSQSVGEALVELQGVAGVQACLWCCPFFHHSLRSWLQERYQFEIIKLQGDLLYFIYENWAFVGSQVNMNLVGGKFQGMIQKCSTLLIMLSRPFSRGLTLCSLMSFRRLFMLTRRYYMALLYFDRIHSFNIIRHWFQ